MANRLSTKMRLAIIFFVTGGFMLAGGLYMHMHRIPWAVERAEKGNPKWQFQVAKMYYNGGDLPQNYTLAFEWVQKAALQNNTDAMIGLADMYYTGNGVEQNTTAIFYWLDQAAIAGEKNAEAYKANYIAIFENATQNTTNENITDSIVENSTVGDTTSTLSTGQE